MKLMTKKIEKAVPGLYETDDIPTEDKVVHAKYFLPGTRWTWLMFEYDPKGELAFGAVISGISPDFDELGYFSLKDLKKSVPRPVKINFMGNMETRLLKSHVEREIRFAPKKYRDLKPGIDIPSETGFSLPRLPIKEVKVNKKPKRKMKPTWSHEE